MNSEFYYKIEIYTYASLNYFIDYRYNYNAGYFLLNIRLWTISIWDDLKFIFIKKKRIFRDYVTTFFQDYI